MTTLSELIDKRLAYVNKQLDDYRTLELHNHWLSMELLLKELKDALPQEKAKWQAEVTKLLEEKEDEYNLLCSETQRQCGDPLDANRYDGFADGLALAIAIINGEK